MKKILLFVGCLFATVSVLADAMYKYDETTKAYIYQGTPIEEDLNVDFTTWTSTDLPSSWTDGDPLYESHNMGFNKWLFSDARSFDGVKMNSCFNNNSGNEAGKTNANTATPPAIYLPTTARGVKSITIIGGNNKARGMFVNYRVAGETNFTSTSVTFTAGWHRDTLVLNLNTTAATEIYLVYKSTDYMGLTNIIVEMKQATVEASIELDKHELIMYPGKEITLKPTVTPDTATVTWSSSNEAVATVKDGKVLGVGKGSAFIYAAIEGAKDSCKITGETYTYYPLGADSLFHYVGDAFSDEVLVLDFMQDLQESDVLYYDAKTSTFADRMLEWMDGMAGLYKWGYYASRKMGDETKGPVLWGNGNCENGGTNALKQAGANYKLPAIYFPTIKNGVKYIVVEGSCTNARTLLCDGEDAEGKWTQINQLVPAMGDKYYCNVQKNVWAADTLNINSADVKNIRLWRNSTDYMFITKITIVPMEAQPTGLFNQKAIAPAVKEMRKGQIVIRKNNAVYNILGAEIK